MSVETQNALRTAKSSLINQAGKNSSKDGKLGKNEFLNLFMTQMSNQDPMNPMESKEMMGQLAQMGIMEQVQNMNSQMKTLNETQKDIAKFQVSSFIGKDVVAGNNGLELHKGSSSPVYYQLKTDANDLSIRIKNDAGETVLNQNLGMVPSGYHEYVWNGKNDKDVVLPEGKYKIELNAKDTEGNSQPVDTFQNFKVTQVEYQKGKPWLIGGKNRVMANEIQAVNHKSDELFGKAVPLPMRRNISPKPLNLGQAGQGRAAIVK